MSCQSHMSGECVMFSEHNTQFLYINSKKYVMVSVDNKTGHKQKKIQGSWQIERIFFILQKNSFGKVTNEITYGKKVYSQITKIFFATGFSAT